MSRYVVAIDQGTTSTRAILFDRTGTPVATGQREHRQIFPQPGWVEHDATEIRDNTAAVLAEALAQAGADAGDIAAIGITNQRETAVLWDRATGEPIANAIVWQDTRTQAAVEALAQAQQAGAQVLERARAALGPRGLGEGDDLLALGQPALHLGLEHRLVGGLHVVAEDVLDHLQGRHPLLALRQQARQGGGVARRRSGVQHRGMCTTAGSPAGLVRSACSCSLA